MIEQREETRQWPADGSAELNPIDVTDLLRDGEGRAKVTKMAPHRVTLVNLSDTHSLSGGQASMELGKR